jgi:hypothetical protein
MKYRARNDFLVISERVIEQVRGIAVPQMSAQGKEWTVESVGPKVEDSVKVGDKVLIVSTMFEHFVPVPGERSLYLTKCSNVALVVGAE